MERVKLNKVIVSHGDSVKKFPVYEIYLDGVIVTKVPSEAEAMEMVSRWQEIYKSSCYNSYTQRGLYQKIWHKPLCLTLCFILF